MKGLCYPHALQLLEMLFRDGETTAEPEEQAYYQDLVMVHGSVIPDSGPDARKRVNHAWVEMGGYAYDAAQSVTKPSIAPIDYYRQRYAAWERVRYTATEARHRLNHFGDCGPWDDRSD
jgi:hypothetical protein